MGIEDAIVPFGIWTGGNVNGITIANLAIRDVYQHPIILNAGTQSPHIYNVHLGTAVLERRYQAPRLAAFVHDHRVEGPKIILGDFNEWMRGLATRTLSSLFKSIDIREHLRRRRGASLL